MHNAYRERQRLWIGVIKLYINIYALFSNRSKQTT